MVLYDDTKIERVDTAVKIRRIIERYVDAVHRLEEVMNGLRINHDICHAIGIVEQEEYMPCETRLEKAIIEARYNSFVSELDQLSCEYVQAMEKCDLPMKPDFPDKLNMPKLK